METIWPKLVLRLEKWRRGYIERGREKKGGTLLIQPGGDGSLGILEFVGRNLVFGATVHFSIIGIGRNREGHQACNRAIPEVSKE